MKHIKDIRFWGAATAAHQVEGNNRNQWTVWEHSNAERLAAEAEEKYAHWLPSWDRVKKSAQDPENYISGAGVDHYNRYEEDFDIAKKLNMNAFRFSIEWSRIEPREGEWDEEAIEHYRRYIAALKKRGIEPMMSLWHWTMPTWFTDMGAFEKKRNIKYFVRFAQKVVDELGDELTFVFTFNEPNVYAGMSYEFGLWPPNHKNPLLYMTVMRNIAEAHIETYIAIRSHHPNLAVGSAYHLSYIEGENIVGKLYAKLVSWSWNWYWLNKTQKAQDFIGINHYFTDKIRWFKKTKYAAKKNDLGWPMMPQNLGKVVMQVHKRYKKAVFITENGLADTKDTHRQWWIDESLKSLDDAIAQGAVVEGYLHWSLLDNFEWADGYWPEFGLVHVNRKTMKRTVRKSARHYAGVIKKARGL